MWQSHRLRGQLKFSYRKPQGSNIKAHARGTRRIGRSVLSRKYSYGRKGKEWKEAKGSHRRKARSREKDKANQNPPSRWGQEIWSAAASSSTVQDTVQLKHLATAVGVAD